MSDKKIAQNNAAVQIQSVQRRKAAMGAARTKRRVKELQRRQSAEIAAVSIQKVVRGRAARAATREEIARREVRRRERSFHFLQSVLSFYM